MATYDRDPNVYDRPTTTNVRATSRSSTAWAWIIGGLIVLAAIFGFFFWDYDYSRSGGPVTGTVDTAPVVPAPPAGSQPSRPAQPAERGTSPAPAPAPTPGPAAPANPQ